MIILKLNKKQYDRINQALVKETHSDNCPAINRRTGCKCKLEYYLCEDTLQYNPHMLNYGSKHAFKNTGADVVEFKPKSNGYMTHKKLETIKTITRDLVKANLNNEPQLNDLKLYLITVLKSYLKDTQPPIRVKTLTQHIIYIFLSLKNTDYDFYTVFNTALIPDNGAA